jgi:hypothetical protein
MPVTWTATLWLDDLQPDDHEALGLARLLWQYRGDQPRLQAFLRSMLADLASLEGVTFETLVEIWPLTAVGVQLDTLGRIVRQERGEMSDDEYRLAILGRIYVNHADGQPWQFYELLEILGITDGITLTELPPAAWRLTATGVPYPLVTWDLIDDMRAGGVRGVFVYSREVIRDTFIYSSTYGAAEYSATAGAGSAYAPLVGGKSAGGYAS